MGDLGHVVGLTQAEKDFLEAYIRHRSVTKASKVLGISVQLGSARKARATAKYLKAKEIIKEFEMYKIRAPSILGI